MPRYKDIAHLGTGGNAEVYECERDSDALHFAKKRVMATAEVGVKDRFRKEVRLLAKLDHPNIVKVIASHLETEPLWFVMPLYESSLQDCFPAIVSDLPRVVK